MPVLISEVLTSRVQKVIPFLPHLYFELKEDCESLSRCDAELAFRFLRRMMVAAVALILEALYAPLLGPVVLSFVGIGLLLNRSRYLLISFVLSQIVLTIASLRLLSGRHSQIINTVSMGRRQCERGFEPNSWRAYHTSEMSAKS